MRLWHSWPNCSTTLNNARVAFLVVAALFSLFYGWYAYTFLATDGTKPITMRSERRLFPLVKQHHWSWWVHQIWINFAGCALGWAAGYYLIFCRKQIESVSDAFLLLIAVVGVFGFLPWRLFNTSIK